MDQVIGSCHVLAELLLKAEEAERRRRIGMCLRHAAAGGCGGSSADRGICIVKHNKIKSMKT